MLSRGDLHSIASARLRDAEALLRCRRYDGAIYLCGYAIEIKLKACVSGALGLQGWPSTASEFKGYERLKTHDLDVLLRDSGFEHKVKIGFFAEWSAVTVWDPSLRYRPIGSATRQDAKLMIESARTLLGVLI